LTQPTLLPPRSWALFSAPFTISVSHSAFAEPSTQMVANAFRTSKKARHKARALFRRRSGTLSSWAYATPLIHLICGGRWKTPIRTSTCFGISSSVSSFHLRTESCMTRRSLLKGSMGMPQRISPCSRTLPTSLTSSSRLVPTWSVGLVLLLAALTRRIDP
jgi:hypothetical protein